jgi:hypothetical protein
VRIGRVLLHWKGAIALEGPIEFSSSLCVDGRAFFFLERKHGRRKERVRREQQQQHRSFNRTEHPSSLGWMDNMDISVMNNTEEIEACSPMP